LRAIFCMMFHSCVRFSFVSGSSSILFMWYLYAASLCSVGWLER
jgi:hypothetical protein